jgi:Na+(H+)/acetate symporter ActP
MSSGAALVAIVVTVLAAVLVGAYGNRLSRTPSDFYVASRSVSPGLNASAIGGEYLSAASFLGVAGLVLVSGVDMLWYPVGYTVGYLFLLVLVAAPLRRSGAFTIPDFAQGRLQSRRVRAAATALVVVIGWLYLIPQMQGAGLTLRAVVGAPTWVGVLAVGLVVLLAVAGGGMRSITLVQAFQYWLKLFAIAVPVFFLVIAWRADGSPDLLAEPPPRFTETTTVTMSSDTTLIVEQTVRVGVDGTLDGESIAGVVALAPSEYDVAAGTTLVFPAGSQVPGVDDRPPLSGSEWAYPLSNGQSEPLYRVYSLMIALFFGTMGLPHVLVRFYTNPDGRAARRTALTVLGLVGIFYLAPPVYGILGRIYTPELVLTGRSDAVVLTLPAAMVPGVGGQLLGAIVAAGAFAAFLSTSSGLVVSVAGVLSQDVLNRGGSPRRNFRLATALAVTVPVLLALAGQSLGVANMVGLAFAVAASSFCPLLLLGIWWRRLTPSGALAGLVVGGGLAASAVLVTILMGPSNGWGGALLAQPAAWSMPLAFATMVVVSLLTPKEIPTGVRRIMVRLHTPESLELDRGANLTGRGGR